MKNASSGLPSTILRALLILLPVSAHAHPEAGQTGFFHGLAHPFSGLDHICAMVAVGLWAAQLGRRAVWILPLSFAATMAVGSVFGLAGFHIRVAETVIVLSVLALGVFIAGSIRPPLAAGAVVVGLFAVFHGYAHGAELATHGSAVLYVLGFLLATLGLHLCGIAVGMTKMTSPQFVRLAGLVIAVCGIYLL